MTNLVRLTYYAVSYSPPVQRGDDSQNLYNLKCILKFPVPVQQQ